MDSDKTGELEKILDKHSGSKILIALKGHPDPDSISSALALQTLFREKNIESLVAHVEEVSHQENTALMKLLGVDFVKYQGENLDFTQFAGYSLVDSQLPDNGMVEQLSALPAIAIIDHHDKHGNLEPEYLEIDKEVGAAATILAKHLEKKDLLKESEESYHLATALIHGIRSDTDSLLNARIKDYEAITFLSKYADLDLLKKISIQALSPKTMDIIIEAYKHKVVSDNYLISGVGVVRKSDRDAIPQAADFLLRRAGIDTVLTYGIVDKIIDCSFRTTNDGIRPYHFIKECFPDVQEGQYGGRYDKGGFQLPLGIFVALVGDESGEKNLTELVNCLMEKRFYEKLGVKQKKEEPSE
jgi:nanoRNase/pAp phosphatase (c-di-AMP/oligoRNAs hydrolase)